MITALSCNVCSARGWIGEKKCPHCHGASFVALVGDELVGWHRALDPFSIALRHAGLWWNRMVDAALALIALGATTQAVLYFKANTLFWFGMLCLFVLVARVRKSRYTFVPVSRRRFGEATTPARTLNGWEEARALIAHGVRDASASYRVPALTAVEAGVALAQKANHATVAPIHLFAALLTDYETALFFARAGVARTSVQERVERALAKLPVGPNVSAPALTSEVQSVLLGAYSFAVAVKQPAVGSAELLITVAECTPITEILDDVGITPQVLQNVGAWLRITRALRERIRQYRAAANFKPTGGLDRAMTAVATPTLDRFGHDLTRAARFGHLPFMVDREKEMEALFRIIEGGRTSILFVGEPGVGKSALLAGLAERMVTEDVPALMADKRLVSLSVADLIAGVTPAEASARLLTILNEVAHARNLMLAVENIDALVGISEGGVDLFDVFSQEARRGYFFCVATTTPARFTEAIESRGSVGAFQKVEVLEPEENAAIQIIMAITGSIEAQQRVFFTYAAIEKSVTLSTRYLHESALPAKAVELLREAAQAVRLSRGEQSLVEGEDVATIVSEKSHVPVTAVTEGESAKLLKLESRLHERVIGQDEAVKAVSAALRRSRAELRAQNRPIASFLFLGPTGVGKTELAKAVAADYFGAEDAMVRLDMSEYQDQNSIARLVGNPGEHGGGLLSEAVRARPFALLLLDEFEKAHPEILNIFLQVMEDGRLTDNQGRTIDFTNVIIVATSNAGSQYIQDAMRDGASPEKVKADLLLRELKGIFRPELLNRFDGVIVFRPLTAEEIEQIAWLMMGSITDMLAGRGIQFRATDAAVSELATAGFDPVFGARPMRRIIQERVENAIADELLKQKIGRRDTVVLEPGGVIRIEKAAAL